jgi:hypothetical protein
VPGLDGTGPAGMGPMTGGARGWCNPYNPMHAGYGPYPPAYPGAAYGQAPMSPRYGGYGPVGSFRGSRPRFGRGFGYRSFWGRGGGWGRGRGRGRW